jgi:hypothetical protein
MNRIKTTSSGFKRTPLWAGVSVFLFCFTLSSVYAEDGVKDDAKKAGRAVGSVVHEVGQGTKKVGKEIGQEAKKIGKAVGGAAKEGFQALKEGGKEFTQAAKGE